MSEVSRREAGGGRRPAVGYDDTSHGPGVFLADGGVVWRHYFARGEG